MRTEKELKSPEFNDNMDDLVAELKARNIPFTYQKHKGALEANGKVKELLGYYPTGEWHIMINDTVSVIKGMVSFGLYEAYGGPYKEDPERFNTAKELIEDYLTKTK